MTASIVPQGLLALCRAGSEADVQAELDDVMASQYHTYGHSVFQKNTGLLCWMGQSKRVPTSSELIFSRQLVPLLLNKPLVVSEDRISAILEALDGHQFSAIYLDHPDNDDAKSVSRLFKQLQTALLSAAGKKGILQSGSKYRCHLVFQDAQTIWVAYSTKEQTVRWPMGIPRLKFPPEAPSRSTLKLAEAFQFFLTEEQRARWLREGQTAVDLGASPGGWTWQLVSQGVSVTAVDNGKMSDTVMNTGLVEHLAEDGFVYMPKRPVHWLVCDMIEKPTKVAQLMAHWLSVKKAKRAIFNLKLPMKSRYDTVLQCQDIIEEALRDAKVPIKQFGMRQLYHNRDEVTVFIVTQHDEHD